jgi:hypothetical protein
MLCVWKKSELVNSPPSIRFVVRTLVLDRRRTKVLTTNQFFWLERRRTKVFTTNQFFWLERRRTKVFTTNQFFWLERRRTKVLTTNQCSFLERRRTKVLTTNQFFLLERRRTKVLTTNQRTGFSTLFSDDATAEEYIAVIPNSRLSGRNAQLRFVKN